MHLAVLELGDGGVADGEEGEKLDEDVALPGGGGGGGVEEGVCACAVEDGAHILEGAPGVLALGVVGGVAPGLVDLVGVGDAADGAAAELHLVAGEGAGLVGKDVLDLAELLDEGGCPAEGGGVRRCVIHVKVEVDELRLLEFDNFHGNNEGDGDKIVVEDNKCEDV